MNSLWYLLQEFCIIDKADNARLTKLLASTGKFDDFLQYNEDNEGLSFIQMSDEYSGKEKLVHPKGEWKYWVPQEAYDVAKAIRHIYTYNLVRTFSKSTSLTQGMTSLLNFL